MTRILTLTAFIVLALAATASAMSSYLHQGEAYVFQTIAARDLANQPGYYGIYRQRPGERIDAHTVVLTITGHKTFGGVKTDCRWTVKVTKQPTAKGTMTRSSGAQGICVESGRQ